MRHSEIYDADVRPHYNSILANTCVLRGPHTLYNHTLLLSVYSPARVRGGLRCP